MTALTINLVLGRELPADMIFLGSGLEFAPKRKGKTLGILARRCLQYIHGISNSVHVVSIDFHFSGPVRPHPLQTISRRRLLQLSEINTHTHTHARICLYNSIYMYIYMYYVYVQNIQSWNIMEQLQGSTRKIKTLNTSERHDNMRT